MYNGKGSRASEWVRLRPGSFLRCCARNAFAAALLLTPIILSFAVCTNDSNYLVGVLFACSWKKSISIAQMYAFIHGKSFINYYVSAISTKLSHLMFIDVCFRLRQTRCSRSEWKCWECPSISRSICEFKWKMVRHDVLRLRELRCTYSLIGSNLWMAKFGCGWFSALRTILCVSYRRKPLNSRSPPYNDIE